MNAKIRECSTLHDRKQILIMPIFWLGFIHPLDATVQPAMCELHTFPCIVVIAGIRRAFIKSHDDIAANASLNVDHIFGSEFMPAAIDMTLKTAALFFYFPVSSERKNLVAATVCQNGFVPIHEFVQTAGRF